MKIGIMGGTFDPIHNGHLEIAKAAFKQFDLDRVWFMPNGNPPHKALASIGSSIENRLQMVELAIEEYPGFCLEVYEARKKSISCSYKTMEHFTKIYLCPNVAKSGFLSYKITVENTETGVLKNFESEHMGIGWITSYVESEKAFKMQSFENKYIIFQKINKKLNETITQKNSKNMILKLDTLNIKSDNIRTLLDLLEEDSRVPDFEYDNKNKEIIIKFELEKSNETPDILDEMYG